VPGAEAEKTYQIVFDSRAEAPKLQPLFPKKQGCIVFCRRARGTIAPFFVERGGDSSRIAAGQMLM
jgi:hypothetical protein